MCELSQVVYLVFYHGRIRWRMLSWRILNMHDLVLAAWFIGHVRAILGRIFRCLVMVWFGHVSKWKTDSTKVIVLNLDSNPKGYSPSRRLVNMWMICNIKPMTNELYLINVIEIFDMSLLSILGKYMNSCLKCWFWDLNNRHGPFNDLKDDSYLDYKQIVH